MTLLSPVPLLSAVILICACACSSSEPSSGETLYSEPHSDGNSFSCETCHALEEPTGDGLVRPGHPIGDAARRPTYKNGAVGELLDAVNSCRVEWMAATAWSEDDPAWQELESFLNERAPAGEVAPLEFDRIDVPANTGGGDALNGRDVFNRTCIVCHGEDAGGTIRAPSLAGQNLDPDYIALRVRTSGAADSPVYDGLTGGRMPFWSASRLSDDDLVDIAAFVESSVGEQGPVPDAGPDSSLRDCESTHAKVGASAVLDEHFHDVGGVATIVDDCTIRIDDFTFDGTGINVQIYGALAGDYPRGFSMSGDIRRSPAYDGETLTVQLPEGTSLDELDGLSVWCVPAGASFGDGLFTN